MRFRWRSRSSGAKRCSNAESRPPTRERRCSHRHRCATAQRNRTPPAIRTARPVPSRPEAGLHPLRAGLPRPPPQGGLRRREFDPESARTSPFRIVFRNGQTISEDIPIWSGFARGAPAGSNRTGVCFIRSYDETAVCFSIDSLWWNPDERRERRGPVAVKMQPRPDADRASAYSRRRDGGDGLERRPMASSPGGGRHAREREIRADDSASSRPPGRTAATPLRSRRATRAPRATR